MGQLTSNSFHTTDSNSQNALWITQCIPRYSIPCMWDKKCVQIISSSSGIRCFGKWYMKTVCYKPWGNKCRNITTSEETPCKLTFQCLLRESTRRHLSFYIFLKRTSVFSAKSATAFEIYSIQRKPHSASFYTTVETWTPLDVRT